MILTKLFFFILKIYVNPSMNFWSKREYAGTKYFKDPNTFIDCSNTMDDVYENIDDHNPNRKRKILIAFNAMIADIMTNKKSSHN